MVLIKFKSIATLTLALLLINNQSMAYDFHISKGQEVELCQEIEKILKEPENKDFAEPYLTNPDFIIPKKYKNFTVPKWENVALEDLSKYIKPGRVLSKIQDFNNQKQVPWLPHGKKYGITQKMVVQKTKLDFDNDGDEDVILRYKTDSDSIIYEEGGKQWLCYVSDAKEENPLTRGYNGANDNYYDLQSECSLFFYKGKVFEVHNFSTVSFGVFKPVLTIMKQNFGLIPVCYFDSGSRELNREILQRSIKISKERRKKIDQLEEEVRMKNQINNNINP